MARKNSESLDRRRSKNRLYDDEADSPIQVGLYNYNEWIPRDMDLSVMKSPNRRRFNNKEREERRYGHFEEEEIEEEEITLGSISAVKPPRKKEMKIQDPDLEIVAKGKVKPQKLLEEEEEVPDLDEEES